MLEWGVDRGLGSQLRRMIIGNNAEVTMCPELRPLTLESCFSAALGFDYWISAIVCSGCQLALISSL